MSEKQYFSITCRGLKINTYHSENLSYLIKDIIDDIIWSYGLDSDEITSEDFDSQNFRELFDFDEKEANALKELVEFKESLENTTIELNKTTNYQFSDPNDKWSLKFEQIYRTTIVSGFTIVDMYPTIFHIEEI